MTFVQFLQYTGYVTGTVMSFLLVVLVACVIRVTWKAGNWLRLRTGK